MLKQTFKHTKTTAYTYANENPYACFVKMQSVQILNIKQHKAQRVQHI
jgi:hypothetical protein